MQRHHEHEDAENNWLYAGRPVIFHTHTKKNAQIETFSGSIVIICSTTTIIISHGRVQSWVARVVFDA